MSEYRYVVYNKSRTKRWVIMPELVCVEFQDGKVMYTNIRPSGLYPGKLNKDQRKFIIKNAVEGYVCTPSHSESQSW